MPYRPQRPVSIAAYWSRRLGRFALALALAALLFHRFGLLALPNAVAVILVAALVSMFVLGLAAIGFTMLWLSGARGGRASFAGLVMACLVLGPVGYAASQYVLLPPLREVSTDVIDPPAWIIPPEYGKSWLPEAGEATPATRDRQTEAWPELTGRRYDGAIDRVLDAVSAVAESREWTLLAETGADFLVPGREPQDTPERVESADPAPDGDLPEVVPVPVARPDIESGANLASQPVVVLQYSHRSAILGVPYDIVVRLVEEEQTTFVDVRAAMRGAHHDLGLDARLVRGFLRDLDASLLGISGG